MNNLFSTPLFGLLLTIIVYEGARRLYDKTKNEFLNPLLISMLCIIGILQGFHIPYSTYTLGGDLINFFLGPLTVALALPLYRQRRLIKAHWPALLAGITGGVLVSFISVVCFCTLFKLSSFLTLSSLPKSITTPMAVSLSQLLGGNPAITAAMVIFTGITGSLTAPWLLKIFRITSPIARGIGIGTAAHALGTSKAFELGETEGAMSSVSIGLTGILTVLLLPILMKLLSPLGLF